MKAVLDTNVLLSGLLTPGICEAILDLCVARRQPVIVLSEHILLEFARHAGGKFGEPAEKVRAAEVFLRQHAQIAEPAHVPADSCKDPDDLPVLGTALAAQADALVTGDRQLLELKEFQGISILSPRAFYEKLRDLS